MWKSIKGYEGLYTVSDSGDVYSVRTGIKLSPYVEQGKYVGYLRVALSNNYALTKFLVHRLVAEAFIPNPHNYPFVNHKDGNSLNNHVDNLEWCDAQYNAEHANSVVYRFISPFGVETEIFNLTKFCRENNLTQSLMWKVYAGKRNHHKGWKRVTP